MASPIVCSDVASAKLLSTSQAFLIDRGRVPVRATMPKTCFGARIKATVLTRTGSQRAQPITEDRIVLLATGEERVLRPPLTKEGTQRLRECVERRLVVRIRHADSTGTFQFSSRRSRELVLDTPKCEPPPPVATRRDRRGPPAG